MSTRAGDDAGAPSEPERPDGHPRPAGGPSLDDADTLRLVEQLGLRGSAGGVRAVLAERVGPTGPVLAVGSDIRFLARLVGSAVVGVRRCDVVTEPLPAAAFDLVHVRLLLELLPRHDVVLRKLATAVRPDGWLLVEDLDWATAPGGSSEAHRRVGDAVLRFLASRGCDPRYGRRLPDRLRGEGLVDVGCFARSVHGLSDPDRGVPEWELLVDRLTPVLVREGLLAADDLAAFAALGHRRIHECLAPVMVSAWGRRDGTPPAPPRSRAGSSPAQRAVDRPRSSADGTSRGAQPSSRGPSS